MRRRLAAARTSAAAPGRLAVSACAAVSARAAASGRAAACVRVCAAAATVVAAAALPPAPASAASLTAQVETVTTDGAARQLLLRERADTPLTGLTWSAAGLSAVRPGALLRGVEAGRPASRRLRRRVALLPSPDGARVAEVSEVGPRMRVTIRDAVTGAVQLTRRFDAGRSERAELCWSPSGARLAIHAVEDAYDFGQLFVVDAATGRRLLRTHTYAETIARAACFSPDETRVVSSPPAVNVDASARIVTIATGEDHYVPSRGDAFTDVAAFAPDGRVLLLEERAIALVDPATGKGPTVRFAESPTATAVHTSAQPAWSPDGTAVAFLTSAGTGHELAVARIADGLPPRTLVRASGRALLADLAWAPDGTRIAFSVLRAGR